jgi:hypothetical protein
MGVADELLFTFHVLCDDDVAVIFISAVAKVEENMLGDWRYAIVTRRLGEKLEDLGEELRICCFESIHQ